MTYAIEIEDDNGDLLDIVYCCGRMCADDVLRATPELGESVMVFGIDTDYSVYCAACGTLLHAGTHDDNREACDWQCVPIVVGRFPSNEGEKCEHGQWVQLPASYLEA